jgi:hypothetical protein
MRSEDGSLIIFGLMIFVLMLIIGGMGVDFMRYEVHRARLQSTLDRAILAASSLNQELSPAEVVMDYFDKAGLGDYITADDITVVDSVSARQVSVDVSMPVDSVFLQLVGITEITAPAAGAAQQMASDTEISLVLDVSGSMGWSASGTSLSKLEVLQDAAVQFVNITTCDPSDADKTTDCTVPEGSVSISIVPYDEQVLVGEDLLSRFNVTNEHTTSSCVTFASSDFADVAISGDTPLQRTGHFDPWTNSDDPRANYRTCKTDAWREILAVEGEGATLRSKIGALNAGGNTSIDLGLKWGVALLDPAAQPVIADVVDPNFPDRPSEYTARSVEKVIVLMTDGANTAQHYLYDSYRSGSSGVWRTDVKIGVAPSDFHVYSVYRPSDGQYYWDTFGIWMDHPYGSASVTFDVCAWKRYWWGWNYECSTHVEVEVGTTQLSFPELWTERTWSWYESFSWLDYPGSYNGTSTKNSRLDAMCDAAKAQDITIFTIGFETSWSTEELLRECATDDAFYFDVDGLDLSYAFASIAREISKLKLVN